MSSLSHTTVLQEYKAAMRFSGLEASARLSVADRLADAAREAEIVEAMRATPRVRPVILSLGNLLVRLGERLETASTVRHGREYA
jgi:hypothetical protein